MVESIETLNFISIILAAAVALCFSFSCNLSYQFISISYFISIILSIMQLRLVSQISSCQIGIRAPVLAVCDSLLLFYPPISERKPQKHQENQRSAQPWLNIREAQVKMQYWRILRGKIVNYIRHWEISNRNEREQSEVRAKNGSNGNRACEDSQPKCWGEAELDAVDAWMSFKAAIR
jgi:hypothetical protein